LVESGELDGAIALSYVLWPSDVVESASRVAVGGRVRPSREQKDRAVELVEQGRSWAKAGAACGISKGAVGDELRRRRAA
jgi:hypothetical protein